MITQARNCDVLVAGEYFCDLVFAGLDGAPQLGAEHFAEQLTIVPGGTYNMALAATRLGLATRWTCDFGSDLFSTYVHGEAIADGLDTSAFRRVDGPVQRVSAAFSDTGERGFISYSAPPVRAPDISCLRLHRPEWLLQTFRFEPDWREFIHIARQQGAKVFLDCRGGTFVLDTPGVRELIALADVFSPNEQEALDIVGTDDIEVAISALADLVPTLLVKRGAYGALLASNAMRVAHTAPSVAVVDTVGAGDAFNAGFLFGAVNGFDLPAATQAAVMCGTFSTMGTGGRASPTREELAGFTGFAENEVEGPWRDFGVGRGQKPAITGTTN